jgi:hypothetical protein
VPNKNVKNRLAQPTPNSFARRASCSTKKEIKMKISVDKNVVEITPETEEETASLDTLWKVVIDCYGNNKKIVPIGQFVPGFDKLARFHIEG